MRDLGKKKKKRIILQFCVQKLAYLNDIELRKLTISKRGKYMANIWQKYKLKTMCDIIERVRDIN